MEIITVNTKDENAIDYKMIKDEGIKFPDNYDNKPIYHYTSISGLNGILSNKKLRFTNIKYMNDKDEFKAMFDSWINLINKNENNPIDESEINNFYSELFNSGEQLFVCCFSLNNDSLPLWNYYTKDINSQGYNIKMNGKKLFESILSKNECLNGCHFSFGMVEYCHPYESMYGQIWMEQFIRSIGISFSKSISSLLEKKDQL